jgi:twitching motility protein PilT
MTQIDRFIEKLHKHSGDELVVAAGEKIMLRIGDALHPVTTSPVAPKQVEYLFRELRPAAGPPDKEGGDCRFVYTSPGGSILVEATRAVGGLELLLRPSPAAGNGAALPEGDVAAGPAAPAPLQKESDAAATAAASARVTSTARDPDSDGMEGLLRRTVEEGCSDLHLSAGNPPIFRKDGSMVTLDGYAALSAEGTRELLMSIAPPKNRAELEERWDTDFAYEIPGLARFRGNLFMDRTGMGGVFRVIPASIKTAEELGLPEHILELCALTKGLVVVTGPTGSGKSTTLAAMIDYINANRDDHIITIEDPIEFVHKNRRCLINQREVGAHTKGFKIALRAALREDPDIVLVGEMRDLETIEIALETAETGHLVFGSLHTTTAAATVDRIIDQFPATQQNQIRTMLADTLKGVIAQTLCKKKGGGRVAAMEILMVTPAVSNLIREGKTYQIPSAIQTGRGAGMQSLTSALVDLVSSGVIDPNEAYLRAVDKSEIQGALARLGYQVDARAQRGQAAGG